MKTNWKFGVLALVVALGIFSLVKSFFPFASQGFCANATSSGMTKAVEGTEYSALNTFKDGTEYVGTDYDAEAFKPEAESKMEINGRAAYLMDYNTGTVMFAHKENERHPIASMVKIMTALLCLEDVESGKISLDDKIQVSPYAASMGGSQAFLDSGKSYDARTLLKSIIVASANDSCVVMAEHLNGSVEDFVARMNEKAKMLGMENTSFANCTGLPGSNHYSSAKDVALMTRELLKHKEYFEFSSIWMEDLVHEGGRITGLTNTNKLLKAYKGCDGGKTGFTNEALFCLSATAKRDDMRLISVVLGSPDSKTRFATCAKLLNFGFANYTNKNVLEKDSVVEQPISVNGGKQKTVNGIIAKDIFVLAKKGGDVKADVSYEFFTLNAPIKKGTIIGKANVSFSNGESEQADIIAADDVLKKTFMDIINDIKGRF